MNKKVSALMWYCGDDVCCCTQPRVIEASPNPQDPRFLVFEELWVGAYRSEATTRESRLQWAELRAAAKVYGVEVDGEDPWPEDAEEVAE